jgi:tetratricopeptide (TPR) repeat protein
MSIFDETGQSSSITEGGRALELFTDRYKSIRLFSKFINDNPAHKQIIYFYGDGGNGKSLLLKYLRKNFCKRVSPDNWTYIWKLGRTDEKLLKIIEEAVDTTPVPSALLDFGMDVVGEDRPQDPFWGLRMLKRQLIGYRLHFPLYDFACVSYLHLTRQLTPERLRNLFPPEEIQFVSDIAEAVSNSKSVAIGKAILAIINKHSKDWRGWLTLYMLRSKLSEEQLELISNIDLESELVDQLPRLFAEDLNAAISIQNIQRLVLFFDTHDAFWGEQKQSGLSEEISYRRDEWFRRLLAHLHLHEGVVAVVAGRQPPNWDKTANVPIPKQYVYLKSVGFFSKEDAKTYLRRAGVSDATMRDSLAKYAQVESGKVHPFYLGLCADLVFAASGQEESLTLEEFKSSEGIDIKGKKLTNRLLRYVGGEVEYAVRALSACRSFDRETYFLLGDELKFNATEPAFKSLIEFSFVWRSEQNGVEVYRIHELLRRLLLERKDEVTRKADEALFKYYQQRGDAAALAESVYHLNRLDWRQGIDKWHFLFAVGWEVGPRELCRVMLGIRRELIVEDDYENGKLTLEEAKFLMTTGKYDEAKQQCLEGIASLEKAMALTPYYYIGDAIGEAYVLLGQLQNWDTKYLESLQSYKVALRIFDHLIASSPEEQDAYAGKARTLCAIGDLQDRLSSYDAAVVSYTAAIATFGQVLEQQPHNIYARRDLANAHRLLGQTLFLLSRYPETLENYKRAIKVINKAIPRARPLVEFSELKGDIYLEIGHTYKRLSEVDKAEKYFRKSYSVCKESLKFSPDNSGALVATGLSLRYLGDLQLGDSQYGIGRNDEAKKHFAESVEYFNKALEVNPHSEQVRYNKAYVLVSLGEAIQWEPGGEAIKVLTEAAELFEELTLNAPRHIEAHDAHANALMKLCKAQFLKSKWEDAVETCKRAVVVYDKALAIAPKAVGSLNNKGRALERLGQMSAAMGKFSAGVQYFKEALEVFEMSLAIAPDDKRILQERELLKFDLLPMEAAMRDGNLMDGMIISVKEALERLQKHEGSDKDENL